MEFDNVMNFIFYQVGGVIRDEILGLKTKDIDYVVVWMKYRQS